MIGEGSPFKKTRVSHSDTYSKQGSNHILLVRHERRCVQGFVTPSDEMAWNNILCLRIEMFTLYLRWTPMAVIRLLNYLIRANSVSCQGPTLTFLRCVGTTVVGSPKSQLQEQSPKMGRVELLCHNPTWRIVGCMNVCHSLSFEHCFKSKSCSLLLPGMVRTSIPGSFHLKGFLSLFLHSS